MLQDKNILLYSHYALKGTELGRSTSRCESTEAHSKSNSFRNMERAPGGVL